MSLAKIWWRAFTIVTCTSLNVFQISNRHYTAAFFTGSLLSYIWWSNAHAASLSDSRANQCAYALGAGCGTLVGMFLGRLWA